MAVNTSAPPTSANSIQIKTHCLTDLPSLEAELAKGLQQEWRSVVEQDPLSSLFQSPGWCMPWYRSYRASYDPYVIVMKENGSLVGIVPMSVHRETGEFSFASNTMADYRDIVALPGYRQVVTSEFIRIYLSGRFPNPLEIGWIDPASDTPALVAEICRDRGLRYTVRHQPCYRWFPPAPQKPSAHKFLNWYKRQGTVTFEVIESKAEWVRFREEYYRQHSLRQIQAGRQISFDDSRKAELYERIFESPEVQTHITGFYVDGRMLAGHFGYVWRNVLLLGPPSIRLEDEQRSPAVILLAWIIQNAAELGLAGFDLTIGDSDFKKRLGNHKVELTVVEVYGRKRDYYLHTARMGVVNTAKKAAAAIGGEDAWAEKVKPAAAWVNYKRRRLVEMGIPAAARTGLSSVSAVIYEQRTGLVYSMTPDQLQPVQAQLRDGEVYETHDNRVEDLLLWNGKSPSTASAITACAKSYARIRNTGRSLHTIVVNEKLAGWGYSYFAKEQAILTETPGAVLDYEPDSVSLYDFHMIPDFRGCRLYQALLTDVLRKRFAEGAARAYITVLEANLASRSAIERVGFQVMQRNRYRRLFGSTSLNTTDAGK
jgi:CelD/BcsL family acetyltransferase involved in cellulose biosynthesis